MQFPLLFFSLGALSALWTVLTSRRDESVRYIKPSALYVLFVLAVMAVSWLLSLYDHPVLAAGAIFLGWLGIRDLLEYATQAKIDKRGRRPVYGVVFVLCLAGACLSYSFWREELIETQRREEAELVVAAIINEQKTHWSPRGEVAEASLGKLLCWFAIEREILIDWAYERERGLLARRVIPIRIVLLNNSFSYISSKTQKEGPFWRGWITRNGSEETVAKWEQSNAGSEISFTPTERREFTILWDGRNLYGDLLEPGSYVAHAVIYMSSNDNARMEMSVPFRIVDAGPEVIVEEDPIVKWTRDHERLNESLRGMAENMRQHEQWETLRRSLERMTR
jgi:hypothetical protein